MRANNCFIMKVNNQHAAVPDAALLTNPGSEDPSPRKSEQIGRKAWELRQKIRNIDRETLGISATFFHTNIKTIFLNNVHTYMQVWTLEVSLSKHLRTFYI
jgi:hypothetical protein